MKLLLASSLAAACVVAAAALPPRHTPELANPALEYDAEHDTICHRDTHVCYPRVFQATSESREIHDGQEVPGGLHIQLDMTNGRRMARLLRPDERHGAGTRDAAVHAAADTAAVHGGADTAADAEHGSGAVTVVRNQGVPGGSKALPKIVATRRSRSRAAEAPASAPPPDLTHFEGILAYLDALAQSGGRPSAHADDIATIHGALAELENYVHSSALQNNAAAQNAALASERSTLLLRHTVEQLLQEPSVAVRARLLYLLGACARPT
ncbi:hypothetical protein GQ42DRAFT_90007 [Ramicandelaber brevisporus]|nr:hypothetical protein GQ42DRAFT_90007 [Ramicandelaber brevisporus]